MFVLVVNGKGKYPAVGELITSLYPALAHVRIGLEETLSLVDRVFARTSLTSVKGGEHRPAMYARVESTTRVHAVIMVCKA